MRTRLVLLVGWLPLLLLCGSASAQARVPGESWLRYADPAQAGFDVQALEAAERTWQAMDSSAFLVIADGAVLVAWGDVERRFMCHSVRKSFLSALYGIYWDRGQLELNKSLADLGIDDAPSPLLEVEKRARILDLLKARSGVFHPAAYAGRTDSRPRGSEGPGRYFAYNNWDFNTLASILEQETGASVFEAFDEHFGQPLGMQDWRVSDGYFHFERDKSQFPAYPFRMSARDAARFGLLFARGGDWAGKRILSENWVKRSSALYSIDSEVMGYGFMWWILREPRFAKHGMISALGVGNQMIAALPKSDMVIVNRANTYDGEATPMGPLLDLIESLLEARTGEPAKDPVLHPLAPDYRGPKITSVPSERLAEFVGSWPFPAALHGQRSRTTLEISIDGGSLLSSAPTSGVFRLYLQDDGSFGSEDNLQSLLVERDAQGKFIGFSRPETLALLAMDLVLEGELERAAALLDQESGREILILRVCSKLVAFLNDDPDQAEDALRQIATDQAGAESIIGTIAERFLDREELFLAQTLMQLNTRLHPDSSAAWNSLAEVYRSLGDQESAEGSLARARRLRGGR